MGVFQVKDEDIRRLLGGYATGTLNEAEQKALFEAALHDEALFEELAGEQALKDLLDDPAHRAELLRALDLPPRKSWLWRWLPATGALAAVVLIASILIQRSPRLPAPETRPALEFHRAMQAPAVAQKMPQEVSPAVGANARVASPARAKARDDARKFEADSAASLDKDVRVAAEPSQVVVLTDKMMLTDAAAKARTFTARTEENGVNLQVSVLRRSDDGQLHMADAITTFQAGETIQLQLTSNAAGTVTVLGTVGSTRQPLYTGRLLAGMPLPVPVQLASQDTKVAVVFSAGLPVANDVNGGVLGGVPPATLAAPATEQRQAKAKKPESEARPLTLDLTFKVQ